MTFFQVITKYVSMHFWPSALIMADHITVSPCLRPSWLAPAPALGWRLHRSAATVDTRQPSCGEDGHKWTVKVNYNKTNLSVVNMSLEIVRTSGLNPSAHLGWLRRVCSYRAIIWYVEFYSIS